MKRFWILFMVSFALVAWAAPVTQADNKYIGVKACSKCHKKEKQGKQKAVWEKSKHSKSFQTLGTDKAKKKAKELGLAGDPQKSENCLICHTTAFGVAPNLVKKKFKIEDGVQCESCHGAGELYKKKKIMKKIFKERGPDKKGKSGTAIRTGLTLDAKKACERCHAKEIKWKGKTFKNPSYKPFDFKKKFDKIKHPVPRK